MDLATRRQILAAQGYLELDMPPQAVAALDEIAPEEQELSEVVGLRMLLATNGREWPEAAALAAQLVGREPENPQWWISYAYALRRAEGIAQAEEVLLRAYDLHPEEPLIPYNLACYAAQTGRLEESREFLDAALRLEPKMKELARHDADLVPLEGRWRPEGRR